MIFAVDWQHSFLNGLQLGDAPTAHLLSSMKRNGDLDNAVLIYFSDHGFRIGDYPETYAGNMENNLPFLFFAFPPWFEAQFPQLVANVRANARRLVTLFDVHKTLLHLLHLQTSAAPWPDRFEDDGKVVYSLLSKVPANRTCATAGIRMEFCGCNRMVDVDKEAEVVKQATRAFEAMLERILADVTDICAPMTLKEVTKAQQVLHTQNYALLVSMQPRGVFKVWADFSQAEIVKPELVTRLDKYGSTTACVVKRNYSLREFCHCLKT